MQTFKVGDWIQTFEGKTQIKDDKHLKHLTEDYCGPSFSLWQPKQGEWCWFWNDSNTLVLAQFSHGLVNGAKFTSKNLMYQYCEPFIGQLPPILRSQSKG